MNANRIFMSLLVLGLAVLAWELRAEKHPEDAPQLPSISRIQAMSDLATLRVQISDSISGENKYWSGRWMLHGEAVLGVDLTKAEYSSIDEKNREVTLQLPVPHVVSSKVDHERSTEVSLDAKGWHLGIAPGAKSLRDEVWRKADQKIARLAASGDYWETTRMQTERVLDDLFDDLGWSVIYEWEVPQT